MLYETEPWGFKDSDLTWTKSSDRAMVCLVCRDPRHDSSSTMTLRTGLRLTEMGVPAF